MRFLTEVQNVPMVLIAISGRTLLLDSQIDSFWDSFNSILGCAVWFHYPHFPVWKSSSPLGLI